MRKVLFAIAMFISVVSYALHVECVGNAVLLENNGDTLFLFENNPEIKSKLGNIDWYRLPDTTTAFSTNIESFYPEHGEGYAIRANGIWEYFWVFDYDSLRLQVNSITATPTCENTILTLDGVVPSMQYVGVDTVLYDFHRKGLVSYNNVQWLDEQWADSLVVDTVDLVRTITVGATPMATTFAIVDPLLESLGISSDTLFSNQIDPIAIKAHPLAIVTTRPNDKSNEVSRPIDPTTLIMRSAPLEVDFKANALNADYYEWELFNGSESMLRRSEAQHKYTFEQPSSYRVTLKMSNSHGCECQAEDFEISIPVSMLKVPNVFTPNGDGANDEFRVVYSSLKEFHCWVYNRWGHLVYQWSDPAKGWDGTINGKPAAEGAYYYVIRALGTDAETDYMMKAKYSKKLKKGEMPVGVYQLSGDINLLR